MLMTALTIYAYFAVATIVWPLILLAVGVREPGMFAVAAPIMIPLLIIAVPLALFFDGARIMSQHRASTTNSFGQLGLVAY